MGGKKSIFMKKYRKKVRASGEFKRSMDSNNDYNIKLQNSIEMMDLKCFAKLRTNRDLALTSAKQI